MKFLKASILGLCVAFSCPLALADVEGRVGQLYVANIDEEAGLFVSVFRDGELYASYDICDGAQDYAVLKTTSKKYNSVMGLLLSAKLAGKKVFIVAVPENGQCTIQDVGLS
jgi:hypothetical protein